MKNRQKIYLTAIIFVLLVIGLLIFLIRPLIGKVKLSSTEFKKKNALLASYQEKSSSYLKELKNEYANLEPQILRIKRSFIDSERVVDFILAVEQAAALTSNYQEIQKISKSEENVLFFRVSVWGSFANFIRFLAQLENMDYFIDFDLLQVVRIEEKDLRPLLDKGIVASVGDVKSTIDIRVYEKH